MEFIFAPDLEKKSPHLDSLFSFKLKMNSCSTHFLRVFLEPRNFTKNLVFNRFSSQYCFLISRQFHWKIGYKKRSLPTPLLPRVEFNIRTRKASYSDNLSDSGRSGSPFWSFLLRDSLPFSNITHNIKIKISYKTYNIRDHWT